MGLYSIYITPIILLLMIIVLFHFKNKYAFSFSFIILVIFLYIIGIIYSNLVYLNYLNNNYNHKFLSSGIIVEILKYGENSNKYKLNCVDGGKYIIYMPKECNVNIQDFVEFESEYKASSIKRNKNCFDYSKYLFSQGINGTLYVNNPSNIQITGKSSNIVLMIREKILNAIKKSLSNDNIGILIGMIIGDTSLLNEDIQESFKTCGITHILAVSGSNISYIIIFTKFIFDKIFGKKISSIISLVTVVLFVFVSGESASVMRARYNGLFYATFRFTTKKQ